MYVNEQTAIREKEEKKALNELKASTMHIVDTLNVKTSIMKRETIIGFPCRSEWIEEKKNPHLSNNDDDDDDDGDDFDNQ